MFWGRGMGPVLLPVSALLLCGLYACEQLQGTDSEASLAPDYLPDDPQVEGPRIDAKPLSTEPSFVGEAGEHADGYPRRQPDMAALLKLLRLRRFEALERWLDSYQDAFEADYRKEYWPDIMVSAFFVAD